MGKIYHVAKNGDDQGCGDERHPFLTIQRAADTAAAGDTVIVVTTNQKLRDIRDILKE